MKKPSNKNLLNKIKSRLKEDLQKEQKFSRDLDQFLTYHLDNPIQVFLQNYRLKSLRLTFKNPKDEIVRTHLILSELKSLQNNSLEEQNKNIQNITEIIKEQNLTQHQTKIFKNQKIIQEVIYNLKLIITQDDTIYMHKKGKLFRSNIIRKCFITNTAFGQFQKDGTDSQKIHYFHELYAQIQTKNQIDELRNEIKQENKKNVGVKKVLQWSEAKELTDLKFRVNFEDIKSGQQISIYLKRLEQCNQLKNQCVGKRIENKEPYLNKKISNFVNIWKIYQMENFYRKILHNFFESPDSLKESNNFNEGIKKAVVDIVQEKVQKGEQQILEESVEIRGKEKTMNFQNENLDLQIQENEFILDNEQKLFASIMERDVSYNQRKREPTKIKSDFEGIAILEELSLNSEQIKKSKENILPNLQIKKKAKNLNFILTNHQFIFTLQKIVIENFLKMNGEINERSLYNFLPCVEFFYENSSQKVFGFLTEINPELFAIDINQSMLFKSIDKIKIEFKNQDDGDVLLNKEINLQEEIYSLETKQNLFLNFQANYKGVEINIVFLCELIMIPLNLEAAHQSHQKYFIDLNINNFGNIIQQANTQEIWRELFYSQQILDDFNEKHLKENEFSFLNYVVQFDDIYANQKLVYYTHSFFSQNNFQLENVLEKLALEEDLNFDQCFASPAKKMMEKQNKDLDLFYQAFLDLINLISPQDRSLLVQLSFNVDNFANQEIDKVILYNIFDITNLNEKIENFLKEKFFLSNEQKFRFFKISFDLFMIFANNQIQNKKLPLFFSDSYFYIIFNDLLINQQLSDKLVKKIILNDILIPYQMQNYSEYNNYFDLQKITLIFQHYLKILFPDLFQKFLKIGINYENILIKTMQNQFVFFTSPVNFSIYSDFKKFVRLIVFLKHHDFIQKLEDLKISLYLFLDVFYFLAIFEESQNLIDIQNSSNFSNFMENVIQNQFNNLQKIIPRILQLICQLEKEHFYYQDLKNIIEVIKENVFEKINVIEELKQNIISMNLKLDDIYQWVQMSIVKDKQFQQQFLTNFQQKDLKQSGVIDSNEQLQIDAYFEILNYFDDFPDDFDSLENSNKQFSSIIFHLQDFSKNFIDKFSSHSETIFLNNFYKINKEKFFAILNQLKIENKTDETFLILWQKLNYFIKSEEISILAVIFFFLIFSEEEKKSLKEKLIFVMKMFNELIKEISQDIISFVAFQFLLLTNLLFPSFQIPFNILRQIESQKKPFQNEITKATIYYQNYEIDYTDVCIRESKAFSFLTGKQGIYFDRNFCKELEILFAFLLSSGKIKPNQNKFELKLIRSHLGENYFYSIQFKISFQPEIHIFCMTVHSIYFSQEISKNSMIDSKSVEKQLDLLPINFYYQFSQQTQKIDINDIILNLHFQFQQKIFLKISINFLLNEEIQICSLATPWNFFKTNQQQEEFLQTIFEEQKIQLPFFFLFMKIGFMFRFIQSQIMRNLSEEQIFVFTKLNTTNFEIMNNQNKNISPETFLLDLKEFIRAQEEKKNLTLLVDYKFQFLNYYCKTIFLQSHQNRLNFFTR